MKNESKRQLQLRVKRLKKLKAEYDVYFELIKILHQLGLKSPKAALKKMQAIYMDRVVQ